MAVFLKKRKSAVQAFNTVYGINNPTARKLVSVACLHPRAAFNKLKPKFSIINPVLAKMPLGFEKKRHTMINILVKEKNGTYQGSRTIQHLPVRGQRTHTNAKSVRRQHASGLYHSLNFKSRKITPLSRNVKKKATKGILVKKNIKSKLKK